jgi:hypothetical protein
VLGSLNLCSATIDAALAKLIATGGPFADAALFAGVASAVDPHGVDTVIGDVTPVIGAAGAMQAVTWGTPYVLNDGSAVVDSNVLQYLPTGSETGSVAAVYLGDTSVPLTLKGWLVEQPTVPISADHPYSTVLRLVVDPSGRWSVSLSWNG